MKTNGKAPWISPYWPTGETPRKCSLLENNGMWSVDWPKHASCIFFCNCAPDGLHWFFQKNVSRAKISIGILFEIPYTCVYLLRKRHNNDWPRFSCIKMTWPQIHISHAVHLHVDRVSSSCFSLASSCFFLLFFFTRKPIFPIFSCWSKLDNLASIFRLLCCLLLQFGLHLFWVHIIAWFCCDHARTEDFHNFQFAMQCKAAGSDTLLPAATHMGFSFNRTCCMTAYLIVLVVSWRGGKNNQSSPKTKECFL